MVFRSGLRVCGGYARAALLCRGAPERPRIERKEIIDMLIEEAYTRR
jgi:hypothetical protein